MKFKTIGIFSNNTKKPMSIFLEPTCEEIILEPSHSIELLAEDNDMYFPMDIAFQENSLQIFSKTSSPEWRIKYQGNEYVPKWPTKTKELD